MAVAQSSATPTPLVQHAYARFLFLLGSWGFDLNDWFCDLDRIYRGRLKGGARNRDRGFLGFADLRGHFLCLSKLDISPIGGG